MTAALSRWRGAQLGLLCFVVVLGSVLIDRFTVRAQNAADTQLEIEIRRGPGRAVEHYALRCNPPTGTVGDPAAACNRISDLVVKATQPSGGASFPVGPEDQGTMVCTQVYGGPEIAFVRGRFLGAPVDARLTRENGCTMSNYDATMKLLGIP